VAATPQMASFGVRAAAFYIDLSLGMTLIFFVIAWLNSHPSQGHVGIISVVLCCWLYFTLMESSVLQATVGKWLMGIHVADKNQKRIGFLRSTLRFPCLIVAVLFSGKRALRAWNSSDNLFHDDLSKTMVLEKRTAAHPPPSTLKRALCLALVTGLMVGLLFLIVKQMSPENISLPAD
jgi:uncharacterized RDD family membrane protein YckC